MDSKESKYLRFEDLSDADRNFIINESNIKTEEDILTHAAVEEATGGALGAAVSILEGIYCPSEMFTAITLDLEKREVPLSEEAFAEEKDIVLANAIAYKTAYAVLTEAFASGIVYLHLESYERYQTPQALIADYKNGETFGFISTYLDGEDYVFHYHVIDFVDKRFFTNSERLTPGEIKTLELDQLIEKGVLKAYVTHDHHEAGQ